MHTERIRCVSELLPAAAVGDYTLTSLSARDRHRPKRTPQTNTFANHTHIPQLTVRASKSKLL